MPRPFDDFVWDELLAGAEEGRIVPLIGPELLIWNGRPLDGIVAEKLAANLGLSGGETEWSLDAVVREHLNQGGRRQTIFPRLTAVMRDLTLPIPDALSRLAALPFNLVVQTTFDSYFAQALSQAGHIPETFAYAPNQVADIPAGFPDFEKPLLYHLLGKLKPTPSCVVCDEDLLEYLNALQSRHIQPERLFQAMESSHLLLIGTGLPDWLCRLLLRITKRQRLSQERDYLEIIVGAETVSSPALPQFLGAYSSRSFVFPGTACEFICELQSRWPANLTRQGHQKPVNPSPAPCAASNQALRKPAPVFISYAREDLPFAAALHKSLAAEGVDAWFDMRQLEAGDEYELQITEQIKQAAHFVPIISLNTQRRLRGWFRREWSLAADLAREFADGYPFLIPILLDNISEQELAVPPRFKAAHIVRQFNAVPDAALVQRIKMLTRNGQTSC
jgi:hypothetical protein